MSAPALVRKGISIDLEVHAALNSRIGVKMQKLAAAGKPRVVTFSEVIRDLLPELSRK